MSEFRSLDNSTCKTNIVSVATLGVTIKVAIILAVLESR